MTEIEKRACAALHEAFCRMRYLARHPLNERGREHLFLLADTAHNIPGALSGEAYHQVNLERDLLALEAMLDEPYDMALAKYRVWSKPPATWFQRLRTAIGN